MVAAAIVVGGAVLWTFDAYRPELMDWLLEDPPARLGWLIGGLGVLTLPVYLFAWGFWTMGRAVVSSERYPPPGMRVVRDTRVVTGRAAVRRGRWLQGGAVAVAVLGIGLAVLLSMMAVYLTTRL